MFEIEIAGIIAEYNPFHNGHAYHIAQTRAAGATHIVAVMSPNFVQRGEPAFAEKRLRAHCALLGGADLVLELPLPYAISGAQRFAAGAVALLEALGCVDLLSFGSECGNLALLQQAAAAVESEPVQQRLRALLASGRTFAAARQQAAEEVFGEQTGALLAHPNDTLAVEYLRALNAGKSRIRPLAIARTGAAHDGAPEPGGSASAAWLRRHAAAHGAEALCGLVPDECFALLRQADARGELPCSLKALETAVLSRLRRLEDFSRLPDCSEGIEHRLAAAARQACSLETLYAAIKCKRYPLARVRRLVLAAFLGLEEPLPSSPPPYLRILGCNARGREILSAARGRCSLPLSASLAELERISPHCAHYARLEASATDQFMLGLPHPRPCGLDYTLSAVFIDT